MSAADSVMVCRHCGQGWTGLSPGARCPTGDGGAVITSAVHHKLPNDTVLGTVIAGKYPLIDKLGEGGFGAVYRGVQEPVGRTVAVKVISPEEADDPELRARFFREARVVSRLSDPATVTLYDYGEDADGVLFMVFEFIAGRLLADELHTVGRLSPDRAVRFSLQILGALSEAHAHGLVHRDLKPENLMIATNNLGEEKLKVLDFGIAKVLGQEGVDDVKTREGIVLGTPRYMSPEQSQDARLEGTSDLYALGIILYEMLVGQTPFTGKIPLDILMAHITKPVPPIPASLGLPPALIAVVMRALQKDPNDRFPRAEDMARALRSAMSDPGDALAETEVMGDERPTEAMAQIPATVVLDPTPVDDILGTADVPILPKSKSHTGLIVMIALIVLAAGGLGVWKFLGAEPPPKPKPPISGGGAVKVVIGGGDTPAPASLKVAITAAKGGQTDAAIAALVVALEASGDPKGLGIAAHKIEVLSDALKDPKVQALLAH